MRALSLGIILLIAGCAASAPQAPIEVSSPPVPNPQRRASPASDKAAIEERLDAINSDLKALRYQLQPGNH